MIDELLSLSIGDSLRLEDDDGNYHEIAVLELHHKEPDRSGVGSISIGGESDDGTPWGIVFSYEFAGVTDRVITSRIVRRGDDCTVSGRTAWHFVGGEVHV